MALDAELESRIAELREGVTSAPATEVANLRSQLQQVLAAIETLKGAKPLSADHDKAITEVKANIAAGASVVMNKRATLLVLFACLDSLKSDAKPVKVEALKV